MMQEVEKLAFEPALRRVEEITEQLSSPATNVDEMIGLYKEASVLIAHCRMKLAEAKLEIDQVEVGSL